MRHLPAFRAALALLFAVLLLSGCGRLIADYSLDAYKNATTLKAETLAMVGKSNEPFRGHARDVDALTTKIDAAYEFAAGIPDNQLSAQQWQILRDPNGTLYGAYIKYWKAKGSVSSAAFRNDVKIKLGQAFDQIICLEANKQALSSCATVPAAPQTNSGSSPDKPGKS